MNKKLNKQSRSETIYSSALLLKKIIVTEHENSRGRRLFSGTRIKARLFPFLHWMVRHTSVRITMLPMRLLVGIVSLLYHWRGNPLRISCEAICTIANDESFRHDPRKLYRQFLNNALGVLENYFLLHRNGIGSVSGRIQLEKTDSEMMEALVAEHGGAVLAVPHNIASAFSSLRLNQHFPLIVVAKNSPTIARTKIMLDYFERMQVPLLMVRGGNPFELSRTLFSVLRSGNVIAATLDNIDNSENTTEVTVFGQSVRLANWAAKLATRKGLPVVPCYFRSHGKQCRVIFGQPIIACDLQETVQHYARFFEQNWLQDPASWAYLVDKRWRQVLLSASNIKRNSV